MSIGAATYGYLYHRSLAQTMQVLADAGYRRLELTVAPPHVEPHGSLRQWCRRTALLARTAGIEFASVNTIDSNLVAADPTYRAASSRAFVRALRLASELEIPVAVLSPGRRSALNPMPQPIAVAVLTEQLERLLPVARELGVVVAVEPLPFGFMETVDDVASLVRTISMPGLRICFDAANALVREDPAAAFARVAAEVAVVHVSDATRSRWAHDRLGSGDLDVQALSQAMAGAGYAGPTIYELVVADDPTVPFRDAMPTFRSLGWIA